MKKSNIRKILLIAASFVLVVAISIGGTLAWLTANTQNVVNKFEVGTIALQIWETDNDDPNELTADNDYKVSPGKIVSKDPTVYVKEGSEPCYIYIAVKDEVNAVIDTVDMDGCITTDYDADKSIWQVVYPKDANGITIYRYTDSTNDNKYIEATDASYVTISNDEYVKLDPLFENITYQGSVITNDNIELLNGKTISVAGYAYQAENLPDGFNVNEAAVDYFTNVDFDWSLVTP